MATAKDNLNKSQDLKSPLEKEVIKIIKNYQKELTKTDIQKIVKEIIPDLDQMIAKHMKDHFQAIASYIQNSLK